MDTKQIYNIRWKLPNTVMGMIKEWGLEEVKKSMPSLSDTEMLELLAGKYFPTEPELKAFCDRFKFRYSTLKTWNVMHLIKE